MVSITVVITAYNVEKYLDDCLNSVMKQTYKDFNVVIVEDCSTDKTLDVLKKWNKKYPDKIEIYQNSQNAGAGISRRVGISKATGDYVLILDSDDYLSLDYLEALAKKQEESGADIVSGGITILKDNGGFKAETFGDKISMDFQKFADYGQKQIIFLNNKIIRRSMYDNVVYNHRRYCEDTPVVVPLLYFANKVAYIDNAGYFYRQRPDSLCHKVSVFEDHLFKALCAQDLMMFFADKPEEYKQLVPMSEYLTHIQGMKASNPPKEVLQAYSQEITEAMWWLLQNVLTFDNQPQPQQVQK